MEHMHALELATQPSRPTAHLHPAPQHPGRRQRRHWHRQPAAGRHRRHQTLRPAILVTRLGRPCRNQFRSSACARPPCTWLRRGRPLVRSDRRRSGRGAHHPRRRRRPPLSAPGHRRRRPPLSAAGPPMVDGKLAPAVPAMPPVPSTPAPAPSGPWPPAVPSLSLDMAGQS